MLSREIDLPNTRPQITSATVSPNMSPEEQFQNKTLRPVIKLQNDLFVAVFNNYIKKFKNVFFKLSIEHKMDYIEHAFHRNQELRNSVKGMIIGQFTIEEYRTYNQNPNAFNKRMINLIIERLKDQVQLFQQELVYN